MCKKRHLRGHFYTPKWVANKTPECHLICTENYRNKHDQIAKMNSLTQPISTFELHLSFHQDLSENEFLSTEIHKW